MYCLSCAGAGFVVMRAFTRSVDFSEQFNTAIGFSTAMILGQALLANLWIFFGLSSLLSPKVVIAVLILLFLAGSWFARICFSRLLPSIRKELAWWQKETPTFKFIGLLVLLLILILALGAYLKPPIGDAEAFYLTYSKIIASSYRLLPMQGLYAMFSQIGLMGEMHYAVLMMLDDAKAAKLFIWPIAVATAMMLIGICSKAGLGRRGQWIALVILFTSTSFTHHITDGKVDLFSAALGMAAFYWVMAISNTASLKFIIPLVGLLSGFAVIAKFSYLVAFIPVVGLLIAWRCYLLLEAASEKHWNFLKSLTAILIIFGFWAAIAILPHLIKNTVMFDAPFAPFFGVADNEKWLEQVWFTPKVTRWIALTYPFALVFGRYPMQGGNISFLILAFLPLVWFLTRPKLLLQNPLFQITIAALLGLMLWVIVRPSIIAPRYILATLLLFIPIVARAAEYVYESEVRPRLLSYGVIGGLVVAMAISLFPHIALPIKAINLARNEFPICEMASSYCLPLTEVSETARAGSRVYFVGYYTYWLRPDLLQCRNNDVDDAVLNSLDNDTEKLLALHKLGFDYLIIERTQSAANEFLALSNPGLTANLTLEKTYDSAEMAVFRIKANNDIALPQVKCVKNRQSAWDLVRN